MQSNILPWLAILSLLVYAPIVSFLDWKYRSILSHKIWLPLLVLNLPISTYAFVTGIYPADLLPVITITIILWFILFCILMKSGADFIWLSMITLFGVVNPIYGNILIEPFIFFLVIFTAATFWGLWLDKIINPHSGKYYSWYYRDWIKKVELQGERIPFIIPISVAFVVAVLL